MAESWMARNDPSRDLGSVDKGKRRRGSQKVGRYSVRNSSFLRLTFRLTNGAAVQLTGQLVQSPGSGQSHELLVDVEDGGCIKVLGECDPEVESFKLFPSFF
jgi:hypothetical protein